jgi:hypothetical protein
LRGGGGGDRSKYFTRFYNVSEWSKGCYYWHAFSRC